MSARPTENGNPPEPGAATSGNVRQGPWSGGDAPVEAGYQLKHYRILSRLGEGGMGVVYRAEDTRLGRTVALKVLPESLADNEDNVRRFEREARAASAVTHPGVATLYDFDRADDITFLTMEYVEGKTLKQVLENGPLPVETLLDCLSQVAEGLAAAHRKGIVHRDLKPENVMAADSGFYKILDFGLARMETPGGAAYDGGQTQMETIAAGITSQGMVVGTFAYMSPEQAQAETVDVRSDIFSFGTLLYELATGQAPFLRKNAISTFHAVVHEEPDPMSAVRNGLPPDLERIAAKCLAKNPDDRFQTAADLAVDLRYLRRGSGTMSGSVPAAPPQVRRRPARSYTLPVVIGLATVVLAVGAILLVPGLREPAADSISPPQAPVTAPAGAAVAAVAPAARNRIAISPFANRTGEAESDWLSEGVPDLLTTDLARVQGLQVISTQRLRDLLSAAGRDDVGELDSATVTQLARWAGAGIVIGGSIYRVGDSYRIDAQAYDTSDGQVLAASRAEGTEVFTLVDQLAEELLGRLKLHAGDRREVLTASSDAYRDYTGAMDLYDSLRFDEAARAFETSLEADPAFALARLRQGMSLHLAGDFEAGLTLIRRALAEPGRLPERERLLGRGIVVAFGHGDLAAGAEVFEGMEERYPDDLEARLWHARALVDLAGDPAGAIHLLRESMDLDPNDAAAVACMADLMRGLNLTAEADAILADFYSRNPGVPRELMQQPGLFGGPVP